MPIWVLLLSSVSNLVGLKRIQIVDGEKTIGRGDVAVKLLAWSNASTWYPDRLLVVSQAMLDGLEVNS